LLFFNLCIFLCIHSLFFSRCCKNVLCFFSILIDLVDLLDGWATSWCITTTAWSTTHTTHVWHATLSASRLVDLHHDWVNNSLNLLLLSLELISLSELVAVKAKQKEIEAIVNPIMMKVYQSAGGEGGMPDMGGMGGAPGGGGDAPAGGPTVEEVD
jgi:hypothetical protein